MNNETLTCAGMSGCTRAVTHIDHKGWAYCTPCGERFGLSRPVRVMRKWEIEQLKQGGSILYERVSKAELLRRYPHSAGHPAV